MNVAQGLKKKARLIKEIDDKWQIIRGNNSIISGNTRKYVIKTELDEVFKLVNDLVELKAKIHLANSSVYNKIFLMSELKTTLRNVQDINTAEGAVDNGRYGASSTNVFYEVEFDEISKRNLIKKLSEEIDTLQDELDYHNATAQI